MLRNIIRRSGGFIGLCVIDYFSWQGIVTSSNLKAPISNNLGSMWSREFWSSWVVDLLPLVRGRLAVFPISSIIS